MSVRQFIKSARTAEVRFHRPGDETSECDKTEVHDESNWLVSYADMMTLLCGFFIMLFSMAKLDEPQFEKVKEAVAHQFGGDYQTPNRELAKFVTQMVQEEGIDKDTVVKSDHLGVSIVFQSTLFFDTLSAEVKPEGKQVLHHLISAISNRQIMDLKSYKVVVEGHTDGRPITAGAFASNWELSGSRAARVVRMFIEQGFSPTHLASIGYADTHPEVTPSRRTDGTWDETGLAKNRRVVIRILDPRVDSIPFPEDAKKMAAIYGPPEAPSPASPERAPASTK